MVSSPFSALGGTWRKKPVIATAREIQGRLWEAGLDSDGVGENRPLTDTRGMGQMFRSARFHFGP